MKKSTKIALIAILSVIGLLGLVAVSFIISGTRELLLEFIRIICSTG